VLKVLFVKSKKVDEAKKSSIRGVLNLKVSLEAKEEI
jgi:hypothetical protein